MEFTGYMKGIVLYLAKRVSDGITFNFLVFLLQGDSVVAVVFCLGHT